MMKLKVIFLFVLFAVSLYPGNNPKIIHIIVALCDNESQGIVPVPKKIGYGNKPETNLYWGCSGGV